MAKKEEPALRAKSERGGGRRQFDRAPPPAEAKQPEKKPAPAKRGRVPAKSASRSASPSPSMSGRSSSPSETPEPTAQRRGKGKAKEEDEETDEEKVRVWWPPTKNKKKSGFAGAFWPATTVGKTATTFQVRYDNGDVETVKAENVFEEEQATKFGAELTPLMAGEFVEVSNGSATDPCAWLARVNKVQPGGMLMMDYPFHDSPSEVVSSKVVRRARVLEDGEWLVIRPHQTWPDGKVSSPLHLDLIPEKELAAAAKAAPAGPTVKKEKEAVKAAEAEDGAAAPPRRRGRPPGKAAAAAAAAAADDEAGPSAGPSVSGRRAASKRKAVESEDAGEEAAAEQEADEEEADDDEEEDEEEEEKAPRKTAKRKVKIVKPISAYNTFVQRNSPTILVENAAAEREPKAALQEAWRLADPSERAACELAAFNDAQRYAREMQAASGGDAEGSRKRGRVSAAAAAPAPVQPQTDPGAVKGRPAVDLFAIDFRKKLDYSNLTIKAGAKMAQDAFHALDADTLQKYIAASAIEHAQCQRENLTRTATIKITAEAGLDFGGQQISAAAAVLADKKMISAQLVAKASGVNLGGASGSGSGGASGGLVGPASPWVVGLGGMQQLMLAHQQVPPPGALAAHYITQPGSAQNAAMVMAAVAANLPSAAAAGAAAASPPPPHTSRRTGGGQAPGQQAAVRAALAAAAAAGTPPGLAALGEDSTFNAQEVSLLLNAGAADLQDARLALTTYGFGPGAYLLLLDAWRSDSPRMADALRAHSVHVRGNSEPDWDAFMVHVYGLERVAGLKVAQQQVQQQQGTPPPAAASPAAAPPPAATDAGGGSASPAPAADPSTAGAGTAPAANGPASAAVPPAAASVPPTAVVPPAVMDLRPAAAALPASAP